MSYRLEQVVPWGRSFEEYVAMFGLSDADLRRPIIGCGDGPAAFNSELTRRGGRVVSVDPLYRFSADDIATRISETYDVVMEQTRVNSGEFVWNHIPSLAVLGQVRMAAMSAFLEDFPSGFAAGRYRDGRLPALEFGDRTFDLALCSHFLFLYSEHLSAEFHLQALREMCRVAGEARVFPLLELGARRSRHLTAVTRRLRAEGYTVNIGVVEYEFQKGGYEMLRLVAPGTVSARRDD
ncbi:MAG: class I SAM-dependent methyltransferase [Gammaproteobacteria bacterium]